MNMWTKEKEKLITINLFIIELRSPVWGGGGVLS